MTLNPVPAADTRGDLMAFLAHERRALRAAAHGLTEAQARATPTASSLCLGGLLKHAAEVERTWTDLLLERPRRPVTPDGFRLRDDEHLSDLLGGYGEAAAETDTAVATRDDLNTPIPVPDDLHWPDPGVRAWTVRWILLQLIHETARHAGHADIIRESIDGATSPRLRAAVQNSPT